MASPLFAAQLLINQSELDVIYRIISSVKDPDGKIVGSLFGLWRHSLFRPVVHLVTGPGKKANISKSSFSPDYDYNAGIRGSLKEDHGLLQIGLWCSGNASRYHKLDRRSPYFDLRTSLLPDKGRYVVLMFVDNTRGTREIEYQIIDKARREPDRVAILTAKDILPGPSSFRLLQQVIETVDKGAMFPSRSLAQTAEYRASKSQSTSKTDQWYESDGGVSLLRSLMNEFERCGVLVATSRKSYSQDLILTIDDCLCLHFPADFPTGEMSCTWLGDKSKFTKNPNSICGIITKRALNIISHEAIFHRPDRITTV